MKKFVISVFLISVALIALSAYTLKLWPFYYLHPVPDSLNMAISTKWTSTFNTYQITNMSFGKQPISRKPFQIIHVTAEGRHYDWSLPKSDINRVNIHFDSGHFKIYWDQTNDLPLQDALVLLDDQFTLHFQEFLRQHAVAKSYQQP